MTAVRFCHPQRDGRSGEHQRPWRSQCAANNSSSSTLRGAMGRDTQVRLMKWRALMFSVVMLPPQLPPARLSVNGSPSRGLPAPSFKFWFTSTRAVLVPNATASTLSGPHDCKQGILSWIQTNTCNRLLLRPWLLELLGVLPQRVVYAG